MVKEQFIGMGLWGPSLSGESRGGFNRRLFRGISARTAADAVYAVPPEHFVVLWFTSLL